MTKQINVIVGSDCQRHGRFWASLHQTTMNSDLVVLFVFLIRRKCETEIRLWVLRMVFGEAESWSKFCGSQDVAVIWHEEWHWFEANLIFITLLDQILVSSSLCRGGCKVSYNHSCSIMKLIIIYRLKRAKRTLNITVMNVVQSYLQTAFKKSRNISRTLSFFPGLLYPIASYVEHFAKRGLMLVSYSVMHSRGCFRYKLNVCPV